MSYNESNLFANEKLINKIDKSMKYDRQQYKNDKEYRDVINTNIMYFMLYKHRGY